MEGRSTVEDRRPRNSYHRVCYVFDAQAASACHRNWTAMGDDQPAVVRALAIRTVATCCYLFTKLVDVA